MRNMKACFSAILACSDGGTNIFTAALGYAGAMGADAGADVGADVGGGGAGGGGVGVDVTVGGGEGVFA